MDRAPSYLSSAKAELCLSELRPTKVRTEALICVNVFLDELLWLVLSSARSFNTERLKIGLLKALPTTLGKEALLEAEVELRAYWEKSGHAVLKAIEATPAPSSSEFPLQAAFELLRHKCEAYSTLGELDEDPEVEARLQARMAQASPNVPPNISAVAPAALYLTAVIEHVCEHVLSNVARVVARNSSQASAHVTDLYAALCEDQTIYNLFRTMKVYEQIERQSKSQRPHKSRSFSRLPTDHHRPPSRVSSSSLLPPPLASDVQLRARSSAESSNRQLYAGGLKPSMEKARGFKLFKNGNSESNGYTPEHHDRSPSVVGSIYGGQGALPDEGADDDLDDALLQDFDVLMRSGATMKVSLTPDRLKTLEVYNKQKSLRAGAKPPSAPEGNNQPKPTLRSAASSKSLPKSFNRDLDENPEPVPPAPAARSRNRNGSFSGVLFGGSSSNSSGLKRKSSMNNTAPVSSLDRKRTDLAVDTAVGTPKRNRPLPKGRAHNRESLDLDDVMDGDEDLGERPPMTPKAPVPAGISTNTRDLIDFLAEGPPEPPPSPPRSQTPVPNEKPPKGRFGRIVSRLGRGASTEQLHNMAPPSSAGQAVALSSGTQIQRSQTFVSNVTRTPSQLKKQRSHGNLSNNGSGTSLNNIQAPLPLVPLVPLPRPPPMPNRTNGVPPSPSHSTEHHTTQSAPPTEAKRQLSIHRKAVPQWDGDVRTSSPPTATGASARSSVTNSPTVERKRPNGIVTSPSASAPTTPRENAFATPPPSAKKRDTPFISERGVTIATYPSSTAPSPSPIRSNSSSTSVSRVSTKYIPSLAAAQTPDVQEMRQMVAKATSVAEARLLVDMFLAQWGFPVVTADSTAAVEIENASVGQQHGQLGVIEMLLGDGTIDEPSEPVPVQTKRPAAPSLIITPTATSASSAASSPAASKPPPVLPARSPSRPPSRTPSPMADKPQAASLHGHGMSHAPAPTAVMV